MSEPIMVACDLHERSMLLKIAQGREAADKLTWKNTAAEREKLVARLRERSAAAGNAEVIFAYEASSLGFGLYDQLTEAGFRCYVLAPTGIPHPPGQRRNKTDERDADLILGILRGHVLAGNPLPKVWVPNHQTRDDRELVRARLEIASKTTRVKAQIKTLLKRHRQERPQGLGKGWTNAYRAWLRGLSREPSPLGTNAQLVLGSSLRQLQSLEREQSILEDRLGWLAMEPRYQRPFYQLLRLPGVSLVTAMTFLTEMGDVARFRNRRQVGAYLGLVPSAHESGEHQDRKGHITRQGPGRVRRVLCQAAWMGIRCCEEQRAAFDRVSKQSPKRRRIAVVASMRRLAVRMWHAAKDHPPCAQDKNLGTCPRPPLDEHPPHAPRQRPTGSSSLPTRRMLKRQAARLTPEQVETPPSHAPQEV